MTLGGDILDIDDVGYVVKMEPHSIFPAIPPTKPSIPPSGGAPQNFQNEKPTMTVAINLKTV